MKAKAPIISKISFTCGECEKKQSVKVDVVNFLGKNHFSFKCKKCMANWIVYFYEAAAVRPTKTRMASLIRYLGTKEPQPVKIGNFTFEMQPLNINKIVDSDRFGIIKIGDVTCGLQPMKEIYMVNSGQFGTVKNLSKSHMIKVAGMKSGLGIKNLAKGAIEK
jgi:hypothetical protein